ncbi:UNVERIFIED_ORG: hypothetical protein GGD58_001932 [Rhizobium pisi]
MRTPDLALHTSPIQVVAVADFRIGCIARLCLNVAPLHFGNASVVEASLRSDEIMAKVPSRGADLPAARKKNGLIEAIPSEGATTGENRNV